MSLCQARSGSPGLEVMGLGKVKLGRVAWGERLGEIGWSAVGPS